jgi:hypothetical protein
MLRVACLIVLAGVLVAGCGDLLNIPSQESYEGDGGPHSDVTLPADALGTDATGDAPASSDASEASAFDDGPINDAASLGSCNLANSGVCRGQCPANASPCGCLPIPGTQTTTCGVAGSSLQGATCSSDSDCEPGYGCLMTLGTCAHWCRPVTTCPFDTTCQPDPSVTYDGLVYHYCY